MTPHPTDDQRHGEPELVPASALDAVRAFQQQAVTIGKEYQSVILAFEAIGETWRQYGRLAAQLVGALRPALAQVAQSSRALENFDFAAWAARLQATLPPNWGGKHLLDRRIFEVAQDDGIPIVWLPRSDIVNGLLDAKDRLTRVDLLLTRQDDVLFDCYGCVRASSEPNLAEKRTLATSALDSFRDGHRAPAQALAVTVSESLIREHLVPPGSGNFYATAKSIASVDGKVLISELRSSFALAPIGKFFTDWYPSSGTPAPAELSRHASVHHPSLSQFAPENALLAVMLMASLLRQADEELRPTPAPPSVP